MTRQFGGFQPSGGGERAKLLIGLGALGLLALAGILVFALLRSGSTVPSTQGAQVSDDSDDIRTIEVLVPSQDIEAGREIDASLFKREKRPQIAVDSRVVRTLDEIRGTFARSLIVKGQPLLRDYITTVRPSSQITARIPKGFRAVTISVDAKSSVEGWARPGAKVDVMWISREAGANIIVQNAEVLSAERQTDNKTEGENKAGAPVPSTVTLLVSAEDAAKIQLAQNNGQLSLNLRGDSDTTTTGGSNIVTLSDLTGQTGALRHEEQADGEVIIGGTRYLLRRGKLVLADKQ